MDLPCLQKLSEIARAALAANTELLEALKAANGDQAPMEPRVEQKEIKKILGKIENQLPYEARFKSWDVYALKKTIEWVTQESSPWESKEAAFIIARVLRKAKLAKGWTVKVTIRDEYRGDNTKWHAKVKV